MSTPVAIIFDWGNTVMRDFKYAGAMKDWEHVEWIPGAEDALKILSAKYKLCIATSADHSNTADMTAALKRVGADRYFSYFLSSSDLGFRKPDPRFFQEVLVRIKSAASATISVGDRYENDISPAASTGMKTVFFNENMRTGEFPDAGAVIHHMDRLVNAIMRIESLMISS